MTIEEKAKRYDEVINRMKQYVIDEYGCSKIKVADVFPELKESEDERIRKALIHYFDVSYNIAFVGDKDIKNKDILAWLEKQGEHAKFINGIQVGDKVTRNEDGVLVNLSQLKRVAKPAEEQDEQKPAWSEEDEILLKLSLENLTELKDRFGKYYGRVGGCIDWLKSLKERIQPKVKWSEEDEKKRTLLISILEVNHPNDYFKVNPANTLNMEAMHTEELVDWLKSLRPQNWKPSKEQMNTLEYYMHTLVCNEYKEILFGLYEDLKKLMEE